MIKMNKKGLRNVSPKDVLSDRGIRGIPFRQTLCTCRRAFSFLSEGPGHTFRCDIATRGHALLPRGGRTEVLQ